MNISQIDEEMDKVYEAHEIAQEVVQDDGGRIWVDMLRADMPDLGLSLRQGVYCELYDGQYQPDFAITLLYEMGDESGNYIYFEQDGPYTTLHNYLGGVPECEFSLDVEEEIWA